MSPGGFFQQNWAIHLLMDLAQEYDYVKISQSIDLIEDDIIKGQRKIYEMRKRRTEEIFK